MKTIIEMALEAGIEVTYDPTETPTRAFAECWIEDLERLAELVRADEREECATVCEEFARKWGSIHGASNKHMETTRKAHDDFCALQAAIRARGNT